MIYDYDKKLEPTDNQKQRDDYYAYFHMYDEIKNGDVMFQKRDGKIHKVFIKVKDQWLLMCGSRENNGKYKIMNNVKDFIRENIKPEKIIECGIGTGEALQYCAAKNHVFVELSLELVKYFNNPFVIQGNFLDYVSKKTFNNTVFIERNPTQLFSNPYELTKYLVKYFKNQFNKNNYLVLEMPKIIFNDKINVVFSIQNDVNGIMTYIIKLK